MIRRLIRAITEAVAWRHEPVPLSVCNECAAVVHDQDWDTHIAWHEHGRAAE